MIWKLRHKKFLSTPSARRATCIGRLPHRHNRNFYPRPPRGGRLATAYCQNGTFEFLSTPSARRATVWQHHSAHRVFISIHALREEGDKGVSGSSYNGNKFLSTPSARRATSAPGKAGSSRTYFYPRPPRGGRPPARRLLLFGRIFLSTPSARRATVCTFDWVKSAKISIHALREEGDLPWEITEETLREFLSTPSARRATEDAQNQTVTYDISIHALREEGDRLRRRPRPCWRNFYPRPPRGGRRAVLRDGNAHK